MEKFPIIAHTLGGLSINDLEKFASAARFCYGLFKHLRFAKTSAASPYPAALQREFYGFYGVEVKVQKKRNSHSFTYTFHAKDGHLSKKRIAPADSRWVRRGRKGTGVVTGVGNSLGPDALATALHREERERLHAEHRVAKGLKPNYVYNFPRDPLECLYSLEHAFAEATDMDRFFGVQCVEGRFVARLTIPGGGLKFGSRFRLGTCETEVETAAMFNCATMLVGKATKTKRFFNICPSLAAFKFHGAGKRAVMIKVANAFEKMNQKRAAAKKPLPPLYVAGVVALRKTLKDSLPEKRFDDEFFVAVDYLRQQSGRKKRWSRTGKYATVERSAPLPEAAAGGDELVPDPMLLGELRAIRRWNRWLAAREHAAASTVFCGNLSTERQIELKSSLLEQHPP
ncbi:hypothetical protein M885DRAFT_526572 [Pelagophyceae sp. CCMP2097]|nr:hypothetical protein M885DRAFT_526572 [Pelagophyceae sp. CCMP2097]